VKNCAIGKAVLGISNGMYLIGNKSVRSAFCRLMVGNMEPDTISNADFRER
jgi:hypothetical protein